KKVPRAKSELPAQPKRLIVACAMAFVSASLMVAHGQAPAEPKPAATAPAPQEDPLAKFGNREIRLHDPSRIIPCEKQFWIFFTGRNVPTYHSSDLVHWVAGPAAILNPPTWVAQSVPENVGNRFWAPDIIKVGQRYLLFYSVS